MNWCLVSLNKAYTSMSNDLNDARYKNTNIFLLIIYHLINTNIGRI
jgi:hypothetical protein